MALSGLDIYKLLPKTNCRDCGFPTCLAFAMALAKKAVGLEKCPHLTADARAVLEASSQPPIKLVTIGTGDAKLEIGNESVMFRHEEKFHRPCGIGFILDDTLSDAERGRRLAQINTLAFERVGQHLTVNLVAVRQRKDVAAFVEAAKKTAAGTTLSLVLMTEDPAAMAAAAAAVQARRPLLYGATQKNCARMAQVAKDAKCPLAVLATDLDAAAALTKEVQAAGVEEMVIDTGIKPLAERLWDYTQIRRLALKKSNRALGYPLAAVVDQKDAGDEVMEASLLIAKYASIVLVQGSEPWEALAMLTLRQNIYTDPQKPLQIEAKVYPVGAVTPQSPLMVTTNFSLSYYTVLGEVEASKVPSYIMSVDTEGMSVLTAWAAEKFNAEKITQAMTKFNVADIVKHKNIIIPGYVAVMSGDLEEQSGWKVLVGPKEAAGLPGFLKKL